jgi:hypothetical protein
MFLVTYKNNQKHSDGKQIISAEADDLCCPVALGHFHCRGLIHQTLNSRLRGGVLDPPEEINFKSHAPNTNDKTTKTKKKRTEIKRSARRRERKFAFPTQG